MPRQRRVSQQVGESRRRILAAIVVAGVLFGIGIAVGTRITGRTETVAPAVTVTTTITTPAGSKGVGGGGPHGSRPQLAVDSEEGAVAAAATYLSVLDGPTLLDPQRLLSFMRRIAAAGSRANLIAAYRQAAATVRGQLGVATTPKPVVIVRAALVGYRVDAYTQGSARVAVWRVGIVGSGATIDPQQSWRTETVSLVWQRHAWKVKSFTSEPGPTPPLDTVAASTPAELFASVPGFATFAPANP